MPEPGWMAAICVCRVCSHRHVSVYPADITEEDNQECPRCHAMAAEPTEWIGRDGKRIPRSNA